MTRTTLGQQKDELEAAIAQILELTDGKKYCAYYQFEIADSIELFEQSAKDRVRVILNQFLQHVKYHPLENFEKFVQGVKYLTCLYKKFGNLYMNFPHTLQCEFDRNCLTIRYSVVSAFPGLENIYSSYTSFSTENETEETHIIHSLYVTPPEIYDSATMWEGNDPRHSNPCHPLNASILNGMLDGSLWPSARVTPVIEKIKIK